MKRIKTDYVKSNLKYRINSFHVYLELYESTRHHFCRFHSRNLVNETDMSLQLVLNDLQTTYPLLSYFNLPLITYLPATRTLPSGDIQMKTATIISNLVDNRIIRVCSSLKIKSDNKQEEQIILLGNVYPNCFACCAEFGMDGKFSDFK